jgi:hypothetical protein
MAAPWENNYQNLVGQLQQIQSKVDVYKGGSPIQANQHINNIAASLARDYGISSLGDIGIRQVPTYETEQVVKLGDSDGGYVFRGVDTGKDYNANDPNLTPDWSKSEDPFRPSHFTRKTQTGTANEYFNKNDPTKTIPENKFASEGSGKGYSNYNLQTVPDGKGGTIVLPVQQYSLSGFSEFTADIAPILQVASVALLFVPGLGQTVGASILGGSAATVAATVGLTAAQVSTAVGAAAISSGMTALQGGSVEDVLKAGISAGAAVGVNFAAGGGVTGAAAGSAVGTTIQGGNASQVLTNAFAAGVGAGVQGAMTENPDAGKILGSAARTYIATGGDMDKTLLNTAATAIGTLDQPTTYTKTTTAQPAPGSAPFKYGNDTYQELDDGTAKVTTQSGNVRIVSAETFNEIKQDYSADVAAGVVSPSEATIPTQTITETAPVVSPVVTDLDLVNQVGTQTTPAVDATELERVLVQGQREANVAPVVTDLEQVTVTEPTESPAPVAPTPPSEPTPAPEVKTEEPKKEEPPKEPKKYYPTVTNVPPPKRPGRQPIITGESPSRLLADALSAYRPSGAIEGGESGKERQNVWNEKSLRLKDALGL